MKKQGLIYLGLSIIVIFMARFVQQGLVYLNIAYYHLNLKLTEIFHIFSLPSEFHRVAALVLLPLIITGIPALLYRLFRKKPMPHFIEMTWLVWFIIVVSKVLLI